MHGPLNVKCVRYAGYLPSRVA